MNIKTNDPPREFEVGFPEHRVVIKDCAHIDLAPDEQITFISESGSEYDVMKKEWGFYATPSVNGRLPRNNLHAVCVKNRLGQYYILLVQQEKRKLFEEYLSIEQMTVVTWLDNQKSLDWLEKNSLKNREDGGI